MYYYKKFLLLCRISAERSLARLSPGTRTYFPVGALAGPPPPNQLRNSFLIFYKTCAKFLIQLSMFPPFVHQLSCPHFCQRCWCRHCQAQNKNNHDLECLCGCPQNFETELLNTAVVLFSINFFIAIPSHFFHNVYFSAEVVLLSR